MSNETGKSRGYNGCIDSAIGAMRYLANHDRPQGGSQTYNTEHLWQIADELNDYSECKDCGVLVDKPRDGRCGNCIQRAYIQTNKCIIKHEPCFNCGSTTGLPVESVRGCGCTDCCDATEEEIVLDDNATKQGYRIQMILDKRT